MQTKSERKRSASFLLRQWWKATMPIGRYPLAKKRHVRGKLTTVSQNICWREDQRGTTHKGVVNCRILLTRYKILMYSKNPSFAASASSPRLRSFAIVYTRYKVQSVRRSPVYDYFSKLTADMHSVLPGSYSTSFCLTCIAFTNPHAPIALFSGHSCEWHHVH